MEIQSSFGNRIRAERNRLGLKQIVLAKRLGISKSTLSKYENGTLLPPLDIVVEMSGIFHRSADFLLFGKEQKFDGIQEECAELLHNLDKLNDSMRSQLCNCFSGIVCTFSSCK